MQLAPTDWPADDADLFALGLDSIRVMRLMVFLEEEFGTRIPDDAVAPEHLDRVSAILDQGERHAAA